MHVTGEQLGQLTGIAAVLRFPLPDIEEDDDESSDEVLYCTVLYCTVLLCCSCGNFLGVIVGVKPVLSLHELLLS